MAAISHKQPPSSLNFGFSVVNAFALPGGYVYLPAASWLISNNEAEFAGVLGHEIGHITARHGASHTVNKNPGPGSPRGWHGGVRRFLENFLIWQARAWGSCFSNLVAVMNQNLMRLVWFIPPM
ncbi:MAG: M48 family metalloprotease [Saprospiraceae bacterium]|nr:M48 family metalloprotease [Saprospiraceae bacterium]